jgi:hypothetical protein
MGAAHEVTGQVLLDRSPMFASRALLDEIRRRQGEHLEDPPDEPDEAVEVDAHIVAYARKPHTLAQSVVDGGLPETSKLLEWSSGAIARASDLESQQIFGPVRSFWCACGRYRGRTYVGIVCQRCGVEVIDAACRRMRCAHIRLDVVVMHPWYAPAAALLLDLPLDEIRRTPADTLRERLRALSLAALIAELRQSIVTAPKARVADQAGRRLAMAEAFRTAEGRFATRPESIVLEAVMVVPPHGEVHFDRARVRDAYAAILESPANVPALFAAFGG